MKWRIMKGKRAWFAFPANDRFAAARFTTWREAMDYVIAMAGL